MKKIYILLLSCFFLALFSCVEDNSNSDFKILNNIEIDGLKDKYSVMLQENLVINPEITVSDNDLSYVWYTYSAMSTSKRDTLSTSKDLNVQMTGQRAIPGIAYFLVYRVTDNKTGVFTSKEMSLEVTSEYTKGLLLLTDRDNKRNLDMLLENGAMLSGIYEANNGKTLTNDYREVWFGNPNNVRPDLKQVFLFGDKSNGGLAIDPVTMAEQSAMRDMFDPVHPDPVLECSQYTGKLGNIEYLLVNGKLNKRTTNMNVLYFQSAPMVVYGSPTDYNIGGIIARQAQPVLYDDLNGRILAHHPWNMGSLLPANPATAINTHFDANNIGDFDYVASGVISGNDYWMILKERSSKDHYLFKFNCVRTTDANRANTVNFTSTAKIKITDTHAPNMSNNAKFTANPLVMNTAFYVVDNKLYSLNIAGITTSDSPVAEAMLVDLSTQNMTIDQVLFPTVTVADPTETNPDATRDAHQIRLLVRNQSLSELRGGVIFYEITTVGGIQATEVFRKIGGFCDQVIDIEEKYS